MTGGGTDVNHFTLQPPSLIDNNIKTNGQWIQL